jgi:hypothetical protein
MFANGAFAKDEDFVGDSGLHKTHGLAVAGSEGPSSHAGEQAELSAFRLDISGKEETPPAAEN